MAEDRPDRTGWVSGPLIDLPREGPFPAFTEFEIQALSALAPDFENDEFKFKQQISNARVVDRINTFHGFYTRVQIDREASSRIAFRHQGDMFEVEDIPAGVGILLWDADGYLETIEGYTMGNSPLAGKILSELRSSGVTTRGRLSASV